MSAIVISDLVGNNGFVELQAAEQGQVVGGFLGITIGGNTEVNRYTYYTASFTAQAGADLASLQVLNVSNGGSLSIGGVLVPA